MDTKRVQRPTLQGRTVSTPYSAGMMSLLGSGPVFKGLALSKSEHRGLQKLYGFYDEKPNKKPPPPPTPKREDFDMAWKFENAIQDHKNAMQLWDKWEDPRPFLQAGADRDLMREAERDGVRMLAWIAKFTPPGEDPLKTVIQMAADAGFDVDPEDMTYALDESDSEEEEG